MAKLMTPAKFAEKIGISRTTIWRWLRYDPYALHPYNAKKKIIAGKTLIEINAKLRDSLK